MAVMRSFETRDKARSYGRNGGKVTAAQRAQVWAIDGESMSIAQIATRLGLAEKTVKNKIAMLRKAGLALTWENLK